MCWRANPEMSRPAAVFNSTACSGMSPNSKCATLRFNDHLGVFARGGSTLFGQYNWSADAIGGGSLADLRGTQDPAVFFEVGMGINF